ncbi:MAG: DUF1772 domain-containing protein [Octadecabacter sp.]
MLTRSLALLSLLSTAAIFGFFYAYSVSAMWGLDVVTPAVAIAAMQGINAEIRNAAFFPAFFLTPVLLGLTAWATRHASPAALAFGAAALVYLLGGLILTMAVNVPMNEALALITIPDDPALTAQIWTDYSVPWQVWNHIRATVSGVAVLLAGVGLLALPNRA